MPPAPMADLAEASQKNAPTERAMKCAVAMEIHAAISTQTVAKGREIDLHFPGYDDLLAALAPFAEAAEALEDIDRDSASIWEHPCAASMDVKHLRAAAAALTRATGAS